MDRYIIDGIEYLGIEKKDLKNCLAESEISNNFNLNLADNIKTTDIISFMCKVRVLDFNITSILSNKNNLKIIANTDYDFKIKYLEDNNDIRIIKKTLSSFVCINLGCKFDKKHLEDLKRKNLVKINTYITDMSIQKLDLYNSRCVINSVVIFKNI